LWVVGVLTSLLTAIYMFRLVFLTFHGPSRSASASQAGVRTAGQHAHGAAHPEEEEPAAHAVAHDPHAGGHGGNVHVHDAPPSMAWPLIILAAGSILAGYIGVPHALGGSNRIETFLSPSFAVSESQVEAEHPAGEHGEQAGTGTELSLMAVSSAVAIVGIGIAAFFFLKRRDRADAVAASMPGPYRLLLNKYYVDELYDTVIVQPIKRISTVALWHGVDAGLIDGAVNGTGAVVRGGSALLRRVQTGSMRSYAVSLFLGVVVILGYYLWW
jgi:NADH-quinone oxidoreductase subunit L